MKIFINPGHSPNGNPDPGACGNNLRECDVVLKIAKRLEIYLKAAGFETKLLQIDGLTAISNAANFWGADYFVSIHCNSFNGAANGTETYCFAKGTTAEKLANSVHSRITKTLPELTNRGVKTAAFSVLKNTSMPAILVETAFIDNAADSKLLVEREDDFARAVACGFTDFLQKPSPDVVDNPAEKQIQCPHCSKTFAL